MDPLINVENSYLLQILLPFSPSIHCYQYYGYCSISIPAIKFVLFTIINSADLEIWQSCFFSTSICIYQVLLFCILLQYKTVLYCKSAIQNSTNAVAATPNAHFCQSTTIQYYTVCSYFFQYILGTYFSWPLSYNWTCYILFGDFWLLSNFFIFGD